MGKTVLACYDKLNPNAFKADLFRYSVVYTYGGCYLDIGIVAVANLRNFIRATDTLCPRQMGYLPMLISIPRRFVRQQRILFSI
jgi:mannosyltransferase OCH1-like enzyme